MVPLSVNHTCYRNDNTNFNVAKNQFIKLWVKFMAVTSENISSFSGKISVSTDL